MNTTASDSIKTVMTILLLLFGLSVVVFVIAWKFTGSEISLYWILVALGGFGCPAIFLWLWAGAVHVSEITNEYLKQIAKREE